MKTCDVLICCNLIGESIRCLVWIRWPHCPNCDWQEIDWCRRMVKSRTICIYWSYFNSKRLMPCPFIKSIGPKRFRSVQFSLDGYNSNLEKLTQRAWMWLNYSTVKDSSADLGVNSKIVQIRPTVKAVCTKMSKKFFCIFVNILIFLRENKEASFFLFWIFELKQP